MQGYVLITPDFNRLSSKPGRNTLIIGGFGGIGYALSTAAVAQGLNVTIMDLPDAAQRRGENTKNTFIPIDLRDEKSIQSAFKKNHSGKTKN